jgi:trimeric autotransporter adhesin
LYSNTSGTYNSAMGYQAAYSNTTASGNTAFGYTALYANTTGLDNTAVGQYSQNGTTSSSLNTTMGYNSMVSSTTGSRNTMIGFNAGARTTGNQATVIGYNSLQGSSSDNNTVLGNNAANGTITGTSNTAVGEGSLSANTTGANNVAFGGGSMNTNSTGSNSTSLNSGGFNNLTGSSGIGGTPPSLNYQITVGYSFTTVIGGYANWTNFSDGRFKQNIHENVPGIDFIKALRPVSYTLDITAINQQLSRLVKDTLNVNQISDIIKRKESIRYSGFVSQEVENTAKNIGYNFSGVVRPNTDQDFYRLRYADFVPSLVKSVQQLSQENDSLTNYINDIQTRIVNIKTQLTVLIQQKNSEKSLQKVSSLSPMKANDNSVTSVK